MNPRRKILVVASWYPGKGSMVSGLFVRDQAQVLSRVYDVCVLAPTLANWRGALKGGFLSRSFEDRGSDIRVYMQERLLPPMRFFHWWSWLFGFFGKKVFEKILTEWGRPDIIHAHVVLPGGWLAAQLGEWYSIPVVLTEHSGPFSIHLQSKSQASMVRTTLNKVNKLIAVSPALADQVRRFDPTVNIHIVGNVIRTEMFAPPGDGMTKRDGETRFLSVALLDANKGIGYLLDAIKLLACRGRNGIELFVVGEGPARVRLENRAVELGIEKRCRFLGMLEREQVKYRMQSCDVFVLPSLGETFGVVLGEAMACGKPVIATRCGGPEFVVTPETGLLVECGSAKALADAMEKVISGEAKFDGARVRHSVVRRFGEEAFLKGIESIYQDVWKEQ